MRERLSMQHWTNAISSYGTNTDLVSRNADVICRTWDVTGGTETVHQRNCIRLPRPVRPELERIQSTTRVSGHKKNFQITNISFGKNESLNWIKKIFNAPKHSSNSHFRCSPLTRVVDCTIVFGSCAAETRHTRKLFLWYICQWTIRCCMCHRSI